MKREYGDELKQRLVAHLEVHPTGDTIQNIATEFKISPPTIKTYLLMLQVDHKVTVNVLPFRVINRKTEVWRLV